MNATLTAIADGKPVRGFPGIALAPFAALILVLAPGSPPMAQGLNDEGTVEAIIGSDVNTGEEAVADDEARIVAAIEKTQDNIGEVRRRFRIAHVDIVFLPDFGEKETAAETRAAAFAEPIATLRDEIRGSAIFYHALDSRAVLLNDVIALDFGDDDGVTIFVAGRQPGTGAE